MKERILVIAEHHKGHIVPTTYEAITFALELNSLARAKVLVMILGKSVNGMANMLAETTGLDVLGLEGDHLEFYNAEQYKHAIEHAIGNINPLYICMTHTAMGLDLAPGLAVRLNASCITAVEGIKPNGGKLSFVRSMYGGKIQAEIIPELKKSIITLLPGAWKARERYPDKKGSVQIKDVHRGVSISRTFSVKESEEESLNLDDADVIVAAGRGIGTEENLHLVKDLAKIFNKSAIGASKAVCDLGWLGYKYQIGMTGRTVSPRLYIACGISGSSQHISGMKDSQTVVSINLDPNAAIFNVSNYCIVEDVTTFIPALLEEYKNFVEA